MGQVNKNREYIGWEKCAVCHYEEAIGNQCNLWKATGHSKAYTLLESKESAQIAQKISVNAPQSDLKCLKCHTTGGGKVEITKTEGVGCEACHGPGSEYYTLGNHVDYTDPTHVTGYMKALHFGMYPILGIVEKHLKNREKLCKSCHRDDRPCVPQDPKLRIKQKMTIQQVDKMERDGEDGKIIRLKHPVHR